MTTTYSPTEQVSTPSVLYDPKFHKIVPIEPTREMLEATQNGITFESTNVAKAIHKAMLSTAPEIKINPTEVTTLNQWQDISTAPRDGEPVLLHSPDFGSMFDTDADEFGAKPVVPVLEWKDKKTEKWLYAYQGYYTQKAKGDFGFASYPSGYHFLKKPTHWMPLPTAPTNTEKQLSERFEDVLE